MIKHHYFIQLFLIGLIATGLDLFGEQNPAKAQQATWPQWRGPQRNGTVDNPDWPDKIDTTHLQQIWRKEIGHGYSGPIVTPDRAFTIETLNKKQEIVRAFDRHTGEQIWETAWDGAMKVPFFAAKNGSWARSTPAWDGEHLFVAGMRDVLYCLRTKDGTIKWRVDFIRRFGSPLPNFGFVCSPLVVDNAVYVQAGASFVKLNQENGDTVWRSLKDQGGMYGSAFSSPIMDTIDDTTQLIVQTRNLLAGVNPQNGNILWQQQVKAFRGMNILTPIVMDNNLFTSSYGGGSVLYQLENSNNTFTVTELWKHKKSQGYMSTPVVIDGYIYHHQRDQRFSCLDPKSQQVKWTTKNKFGQYWSLVTNGDKILALDQRSELLLIDADPEAFKLMDRRKIAQQDTWGHLAVAGNQVFIRELQALSVYRWQKTDAE